MRKHKNIFDQVPVRNWDIAKECEDIFLNTIEKRERYQRIKMREEALVLVSLPTIGPFKQNIN